MTRNSVITVAIDNKGILIRSDDPKDRNRSERHSQQFFNELKQNRLAVYIKLCDVKANVLFSMLTDSDMYQKYTEEFDNLHTQLYIKDEYDPLWFDLRNLVD